MADPREPAATAASTPSARVAEVPRAPMSVALDDCWNRIGVRGDRTCERLTDAVHCRNCAVYARAAMALLDRPRVDTETPAHAGPSSMRGASNLHGESERRSESGASGASGALGASGTSGALRASGALGASVISAQSGRSHATPVFDARLATESVLVFRLGEEWLALPTTALRQVAPMRTIHRIPHRKHPALLGVVNIQGALRLCIALSTLLGVEASPGATRAAERQRLLVVDVARPATGDASTAPAGSALAFEPVVIPVDEVEGVHRFPIAAREAVPATVAGKAIAHAHAVLRIHERTIGLLDAQVVFDTLERSLR